MRFSTLVSVGMVAGILPHSTALAKHVIYVNAGATGANHGTSWIDAYTDLQDALCEAGEPDTCTEGLPCEIWVTGGVYKPDSGTGDRYATFQMLSNVALYGGFAGWETRPEQRDWQANETVLSGDLNGDDGRDDCAEHSDCCVAHEEPGCDDPACEKTVCARYPACCSPGSYSGWSPSCASFASIICCELGGGNRCENSYHILTASGTDDSALLDGFTVLDGNADVYTPTEPEMYGGGMFNEGGSPTISNCTFRGNRAFGGGAMYNTADASPLLTNCLFVENRGGAISGTLTTDLVLIDCRFTANIALGATAITTTNDTTVTLINCAFDRNSGGGAAVSALSTDLLAIGCTFVENASTGAGGGGVHMNGFVNTAILIDCDFIANTVGPWTGAGAVYSQVASLTIDGCTFIGNSAAASPGAVDASWGSVTVRNSLFVGNSPGAVRTKFGSVAIVNCAFVGNQGSSASAYRHDYGSAWVTNSTFAGNRRVSGFASALAAGWGNMTVTNCLLWGNSDAHGIHEESQIRMGPEVTLTINNSIVSGWTGSLGGEGNSGHDPLFVQEGYWDDAGTPDDILDDEWIDGDYRLLRDSTVINTGDLNAPYLTDTDLDGHARVLCDEVDRGAYEFGIGDYDCDQLVNLTDFAAWQACMTGPQGGPYDPACEAFDFGADGHIDLTDFAGFQRGFGGP